MNDNQELEIEKLEQALAWHLSYNFTPPQPPELLDYCIEAISACEVGECDRVISLPRGVSVTAWELVEDLRLEDLIRDQQ